MKRLQNVTTLLLFTWAITMIAFYLAISRIGYVQGFFFPEQIPWMQQSTQTTDWIVFAGDLIISLTGLVIFSLASTYVGQRLLRQAGKSLPGVLTAFLVGEIVLSTLFLTLLFITGLSPKFTSAILLVLAAGNIYRFMSPQKIGHLTLPTSPRLTSLVTLIFIVTLTLSSARLGYDAVAYYFSQARLMAISGAPLFSYAGDAFVVSSFHPGILFTVLIQAFGDQSARLLSWMHGLIIALLGMALGQKVGLSERARLYVAVLLLTSTAFVDLLGDGKVELISTAPILAALWWMLDSLSHPSRGRFLLIGLLLGFSIIARPYNIFLVPVFTVLFYLLQVWPVWQREGLPAALRFARPVLWMFPTLLGMGAFHLWQNAAWLGSPWAPITYAQSLDSSDWQWQFDATQLNILRLLYPLTVTFVNTPQSLGNLSPLFIGFLPFLLSKEVRTRLQMSEHARHLLFPALVTQTLWLSLFFTIVEIRYIFFLWVIFFLFGAQVIEAAQDTLQPGYQNLTRALIALLFIFMGARTILIVLNTYSPIDNNGWARCQNNAFCTLMDPVNERAAPGERVLALNAYRYYLRPDLFACASQAQEYAPLQALAALNDPAFWVEAYRQGYRYIIFEKNFAEFHSRFGALPSPQTAPAWLKVTNIYQHYDDFVLHLEATNPPFLPETTCRQTADSTWQVTRASGISQP